MISFDDCYPLGQMLILEPRDKSNIDQINYSFHESILFFFLSVAHHKFIALHKKKNNNRSQKVKTVKEYAKGDFQFREAIQICKKE